MIDPAQWEELDQRLARARRIHILNPRDADADSLGATLALAAHLEPRGKSCLVFAAKTPSDRLDFLPGFDAIVSDPRQLLAKPADLVITADFSDLRQLGLPPEIVERLFTGHTVNLDHHRTNMRFARLNIVDPEAAATTEMLYAFFEARGIRYDKQIATCLLTGIVADTGCFSHLNTTDRVIAAASHLLIRGARLRTIVDRMSRKSLPMLKLWGLALSRLRYAPAYGLSITVITRRDLEELQVPVEATEGIANFLNSLTGSRAVLVLREEGENEIRGSLRSTEPGVDVSSLARVLGGGGHTKAAGFSLPGHLIQQQGRWQIL